MKPTLKHITITLSAVALVVTGFVHAQSNQNVTRVTIKNRHWNNGVNVEVRKGNQLHPQANPSLGVKRLALNQKWVIQSTGEDIWYRRDANPDHPNGQFTVYSHIVVPPGADDKLEEL